MRPRIGITPAIAKDESVLSINKKYADAVTKCGGLPFILCYTDLVLIDGILGCLDGILLSGGGDVDARFFHENPHINCGEVNLSRDEFEIALCKKAIAWKIPLLGICRGMQVMAVACGARLYQDIYSQKENVMSHTQTAPRHDTWHQVTIDRCSKLFEVVEEDTIFVNSMHHQGVATVPNGMKESAKADDGLIEGIEIPEHPFALGVQWHPEWMFAYPHGKKIFMHFIAASY